MGSGRPKFCGSRRKAESDRTKPILKRRYGFLSGAFLFLAFFLARTVSALNLVCFCFFPISLCHFLYCYHHLVCASGFLVDYLRKGLIIWLPLYSVSTFFPTFSFSRSCGLFYSEFNGFPGGRFRPTPKYFLPHVLKSIPNSPRIKVFVLCSLFYILRPTRCRIKTGRVD